MRQILGRSKSQRSNFGNLLPYTGKSRVEPQTAKAPTRLRSFRELPEECLADYRLLPSLKHGNSPLRR
jgi:hypothetical protein